MTPYKQGDVVLLPFPPTNYFSKAPVQNKQATLKKRPAVIINADWFFYLRGDYIVVALTSQPPKDELDVPLKYYSKAGLPKPSVARVGKYATIHPSVIIKKLGELTEHDLKNILRHVIWPFV
ncbi:hypothetical protein Desku_0900 [Desulfofundulus kuznetsovii DSM 6115]|uniref:Transcriptional modulator of MazE/toxin, MazF n=1 Tax=Desulfofundulus kuznetsovii (strain DSM 6115 / VKM B-1805 / 17) TaxID=760568 RepID=A0AAU8PUI1_DESK7|nr:hypothetical protein Desku_0900 [Desulfofundulus kuznetsovii DSM 6115]